MVNRIFFCFEQLYSEMSKTKNNSNKYVKIWMQMYFTRIIYEIENKRNEKATKQPNQEYYVNKMNNMSFSRFIFTENQDEILKELYEYLEDDKQ